MAGGAGSRSGHLEKGRVIEGSSDDMRLERGIGLGCWLVIGALAVGCGADRPWISYYDATHGDLKLARWTGSAWAIETVDEAGDVGRHTSLALDLAGHPHIAYGDVGLDQLRYAYWSGSSWQLRTADPAAQLSATPALAFHPDGHPHVFYAEYGAHRLHHTRLSCP